MLDLLLVGGGGHCKSVIDVVEKTGQWRIAGIVDPSPGLTEVGGYPVLGSDENLAHYFRRVGHALVTVGQIKDYARREAIYSKLKRAGFTLPTVVSPLAEVSKRAVLGEGTIVMHFGCVCASARIGRNNIINTRALVEHDCQVGNHCHISTASVLNGNVQVGDFTMIGSNAIVREGVKIGARSIVAMGSLVKADVSSDTIFSAGGARENTGM